MNKLLEKILIEPLKPSLLILCLLGTVNANAVPIDNGWYTTSNNLDWLDVTITDGMSYNEVTSWINDIDFINQYGSGWQYATGQQFDQLMMDFSFSPTTTGCNSGGAFCDSYEGEVSGISEALIILGDTTYELFEGNSTLLMELGNGASYGLLSDSIETAGGNTEQWVSSISDSDYIYNGTEFSNADVISTHAISQDSNFISTNVGSWLVRSHEVVEVPEPTTLLLFCLGLIGLYFSRYHLTLRKKA